MTEEDNLINCMKKQLEGTRDYNEKSISLSNNEIQRFRTQIKMAKSRLRSVNILLKLFNGSVKGQFKCPLCCIEMSSSGNATFHARKNHHYGNFNKLLMGEKIK